MTINGHEYSQEEVFEALREKGYMLVEFTYTDSEAAFMGGLDSFEVNTYCALKPGHTPIPQRTWQNVAIKEFQKRFVKPPLI